MLGLPFAVRTIMAAYVATVLVVGMMMIHRLVPMGGVDETYHFRRALQVSEGGLLPRRFGPNDWGGRLDRRMVAFARWFDDRRNDHEPATKAAALVAENQIDAGPGSGVTDSFPSTASYSPLPYLPAALGLLVARWLGAGPLAQVYDGRVGNLIGFVLGVVAVIRVLPLGHVGALILLTTPMAIQLAASYSADPMTNVVSGLFAAWCLRLRATNCAGFSAPRKALFLLLAVSVGLLKLTCAWLAALCLLIPKSGFGSGRRAWSFRLLVIAACVGAALAWNLSHPFVPGLYWSSGAEPGTVLHRIVAHPYAEALFLYQNMRHSWLTWWIDGFGLLGAVPQPLLAHFSVAPVNAALVLIGLIALSESRDRSLPLVGILLSLVAVGYTLFLLVAFQVGFSPPSSPTIAGLQGRYFLLPFLLAYLGVAVSLPPWFQARGASVILLGLYSLFSVQTMLAILSAYARDWS